MGRRRGNPELTEVLKTLGDAELLAYCQSVLDAKIAMEPPPPPPRRRHRRRKLRAKDRAWFCRACGIRIFQKPGRGHPRYYCNDTCATEWRSRQAA